MPLKGKNGGELETAQQLRALRDLEGFFSCKGTWIFPVPESMCLFTTVHNFSSERFTILCRPWALHTWYTYIHAHRTLTHIK